jgi:hypothetical protein
VFGDERIVITQSLMRLRSGLSQPRRAVCRTGEGSGYGFACGGQMDRVKNDMAHLTGAAPGDDEVPETYNAAPVRCSFG